MVLIVAGGWRVPWLPSHDDTPAGFVAAAAVAGLAAGDWLRLDDGGNGGGDAGGHDGDGWAG